MLTVQKRWGKTPTYRELESYSIFLKIMLKNMSVLSVRALSNGIYVNGDKAMTGLELRAPVRC